MAKEFKEYLNKPCPVCEYGKLYRVKTAILCSRCGYNISNTPKTNIETELKKASQQKSLKEQADDLLRSYGFTDLTNID